MHPTEDPTAVALEPWWHPMPVADGECWHFGIGPLSIYVTRQADQWLLASKHLEDVEDHYRVVKERMEAMPEDVEGTRYVFKNAPTEVCLKAKLLDRPVVFKTTQQVRVPPGESTTFYIGSPVCVSIEFPAPKMVCQELPSVLLSDTWFGPSTREGELCYAAKTHARIIRNEVPLRPHRAITPVTVDNMSDEFLAIEKLSIPVPFLAVYGAEDGKLWTDPVVLSHIKGSPLATFSIGKEAPAGELLTAARAMPLKGGLVRAFTNIFAIY